MRWVLIILLHQFTLTQTPKLSCDRVIANIVYRAVILAGAKFHVEVDSQNLCLVHEIVQILVVLAKGLKHPLLSVLILVIEQESTDAPAVETSERGKG